MKKIYKWKIRQHNTSLILKYRMVLKYRMDLSPLNFQARAFVDEQHYAGRGGGLTPTLLKAREGFCSSQNNNKRGCLKFNL